MKLKVPDDKRIDTLIINGVECEPYLTTDHRVMLEQQADIFTGIRYLLKVTGAERAIIGVEANKLDVAASLRAALPGDIPATVEVVAVKYPQGAEKMLISALLGREVPSGGLPSDVSVVSVNVATTAEIGRLLPHGRGIQERVITIGGPAIAKKGNYRIPIGTPLRFALDYAGMARECQPGVPGRADDGPGPAQPGYSHHQGHLRVYRFQRCPDRCARRVSLYPLRLLRGRLPAVSQSLPAGPAGQEPARSSVWRMNST